MVSVRTFEMMMGHANRQLQKMTDRYLLIGGQEHVLELNVVDNYQASGLVQLKIYPVERVLLSILHWP